MTPFADLPHDERMRYRRAINNAGGEVAAYCTSGVQVAIPYPFGPFHHAMRQVGLSILENSMHHFPLGTDHPPERLRHSAPKYGTSRGFWLYAIYTPTVPA